MQKGLITILTPCYNTGNILYRLLDSILMQDYPSVEMFAINDGSSDNTESVIKSYIPKFENKGYKLNYIWQTNSGQSAAINNGLKYVNGEFLTWPDSDDYYSSKSALSKFVNALANANDDVAMVRCLPTCVSEKDCSLINVLNINAELKKEKQFENCLYSRNFIWPPINYMIKTNAFFKSNPTKSIYVEKNAGQNWQMLLPILYTYKCITLNEHLCHVLIRVDSHSRGQYKTYEQLCARLSSYKNTIYNTLRNMPALSESEISHYCSIIDNNYKLIEYDLAIQYKDTLSAKRIKEELLKNGIKISFKQELIFFLKRNKFTRKLLTVIRRLGI